jgi:hypothetical protein
VGVHAWSCLIMLPFETSQNRIVWSYPPDTSIILGARDMRPLLLRSS